MSKFDNTESFLLSANPSRLTLVVIGLISSATLTACQTLPSQPHLAKSLQLTARSQQTASQFKHDSRLIRQISQTTNPNPSKFSGYYPLIASNDAFAARSILTQLSQHSIDIQYYIWHNDAAGQLMLKDLYHAANRGVKVRLLLDDLNTNPELDQQLLAFAQHPNIAVRLINPKTIRSITAVNFVTALPRYQRRMHNKSMTFDHQLSIIGGRNIGDEYLRSDTANEFADLDVLLAGNVVNSIDDSFEQYWQSPLSYDIERLVMPAKNPQKNLSDEPFLQTLTKLAPVDKNSQLVKSSQLYKIAEKATIDKELLNKKVKFQWKPIVFLADDVSKLSKNASPATHLVNQLRALIGTPKRQFSLISSYFVPTPLGIAELNQLAHDGVKVQVLTNSFGSTDVPIVHSGYSHTRQALTQAGVTLYELKPNADPDFRQKKRRLSRKDTNTSLHTKAFAVDERLAFIGSYNVDPRSANINTEVGVVIFDPTLARAIHQSFNDDLLTVSYRVVLSPDNRLQWVTHADDEKTAMIKSAQTTAPEKPQQTLDKEPNLSRFNDMLLKFIARLPFNSLL